MPRVGRRLKLFADSTTLLRATGGNALLHISMLAVTVGEILMGGPASVDFRPKILDEESLSPFSFPMFHVFVLPHHQ